MPREARLIRSSPTRSSRSCHDSVNPCLRLGAVPDDGEAPGRAAQQQHLPLRVGQLLGLVHDDVGERPGEQVGIGAGHGGLVDEVLPDVRVTQHRHDALAVVVGRDEVVDDRGHLLALGLEGGLLAPRRAGRLRVAEPAAVPRRGSGRSHTVQAWASARCSARTSSRLSQGAHSRR